jgi:hypothetical protein
VVEIQPSSIDKDFNVSAFHGDLLDISNGNTLAEIFCSYNCSGDYDCDSGPPPFPEATENESLFENCSAYGLVHLIASRSQYYQGYT